MIKSQIINLLTKNIKIFHVTYKVLQRIRTNNISLIKATLLPTFLFYSLPSLPLSLPSIILNMLEQPWLLDGLTQPIAILDMTAIIRNPRVEYITQRILPQKQVTQHSHTLRILIVQPHIT